MDATKAKSRATSGRMTPADIERRLELVDDLRELAIELSKAIRLGPVVGVHHELNPCSSPASDRNLLLSEPHRSCLGK